MPSDRHIEVSSPLGKELLFHRMRMTEELGRMFHLDLELLSHNHDIALDSLLGKNISIHMKTKDGRERYFHGIATHFSHVGSHEHYAHYTATLRPWLWLLTRTADCRIFQKKDGVNTAPDIIKKVFRDHGFTNFDDRLTRTDYRDREYTVQYRETAFNFVSRLMEHEGIYYFFEHEKSQHTLVLADSYSAHSNAPGYVKIPYFPPDSHSRREEEHFNDVTVAQEVQPGQYKVESFDFEKPKAVLQASSAKAQSHDHSSFEVFDYPADYSESIEGENYARIRLEEFQAQYEVVSAAGDACGVGTGNLFTLEDHPRQTLNQEYLVVSSTHELVMGSYESGSTGSSTEMKDSIQIHAIESHTPFRCEETTPNPVIYGPHTAIVVGKKGEEIWTEEHGRVKVQFHWDREGKLDEQSSCWVRVSQIWAGKGWGGMELPRMGQEVIVHFMAGDPDQPIVTGRVYNENHKVPYELPANQTQSGIKSRSTKGGS